MRTTHGSAALDEDAIKLAAMGGDPGLTLDDLFAEHDGLFDATPGCDGTVIDNPNFSGVKCSKCSGWFCF